MHLIVIAALAAVCGAAKLDRTYLPPASAKTAGGSVGALQTPFGGASFRSQGNQGLGGIPQGAYGNDFGGVVVDAAAAGTRAAGSEGTGLGAPRLSYGSQASRVGEAAFRGSQVAGFRQFPSTQSDDDSVNAATNGNPAARFGNGNGQGARFQASSVASVRQQPSGFDRPSFSAEPVEAERPNAEQERGAGILRYNSEVGTDSYSYSFETDNGITAEENGVVTNGVQAQGGFSYTGDDGQTYSVTYTADENGYQPKGDHLPTPPPIPDAILKSLEQNAKEEADGHSDDGSYNAQKYNAGSDYNESDNHNGRYNGGQSNKGTENGVIATAEAVSGFANQNGGQSSQKTQIFRNDQQRNGFNSQVSSQNGKAAGFGNNNGFSQSASAEAHSGSGQTSGNGNAYGAASQSLGNIAGGFGQSFQGRFGQQKQGQRFGSQSNSNANTFGQLTQNQGSGFGVNNNNMAQQIQEQATGVAEQSSNSNNNKFDLQTQAQSSNLAAQSSGNKFAQQTQQQTTDLNGQFASGKFGQHTNGQSNKLGQQTQAEASRFGAQSTQDEASDFGAQSVEGQAIGFGAQSTQGQASFGAQSNGNTNNFGRQTQAQASGFGAKSTQGEGSGLGIQSIQGQASGSGAQFAQRQSSFGTQSKGNANSFGQQTQAQASKFGAQNFGYLPPEQNGGRKPQVVQRPRVPETTSSNSQFQSSSQQLTGATSELRPTKQPDTTLTTPFETQKFDSASQQASNENGQLGQTQQSTRFNGQFSQVSAEVQQPQTSFSRLPSNQDNGFGRFPQKDGARPQTQTFRQHNAPQSSASSFASFNSQETVTSADLFNNDDDEQTTGVPYTDTTPTTESIDQFDQFNQAQNLFNHASQGQFNQGSQTQNRPNQFSVSTQKPFSQNYFAHQQSSDNGQDDSYYYKQPSEPFRVPETSQNQFQGASSGQFDRMTEQPTFNAQSSAQLSTSTQQSKFGSRPNFQSQQSSTKYPRPPTLPAVAPTSTVNTETEEPQTTFQGQFTNGVTQASASSFASNVPASQFNGGNSQKFPQRQQSSQFNSQSSFSRPQSQSFSQQTTANPSSFSQQNQYDQSGNGFNQYSGDQAFGQRLTNNQQFGHKEPKEELTTETPASTYDGEVYQYNKPAEVLPAPSQDPTPQGSEETPVQVETEQPEQNAQSQGQFSRNQYNQAFGMGLDERGQFEQQSSQFTGASASSKVDGDTGSSVAGKGEVFGGPRQPPSFDEETGYHY